MRDAGETPGILASFPAFPRPEPRLRLTTRRPAFAGIAQALLCMPGAAPDAVGGTSMTMTRAAALAAATAAALAAPAQADEPAPAHDYVRLEKPFGVVGFWDRLSVRREGDVLSFDILNFNHSYSFGAGPKPTADLRADSRTYRVSCGLRAVLDEVSTEVYAAGAITRPRTWRTSHSDADFLGAKSNLTPLVDKLCEGAAPAGAAGLPGLAEAVAVAMAEAPPPLDGVPAIPIGVRQPDPAPAPWMAEDAARRFVPVALADPEGAQLFVDQAGQLRRGERVETLTLSLLGADAQRRASAHADVVVLRKVRYDCKARSAAVLAQAGWNRHGEFTGEDQTPLAARTAGQSPILAAEIAAACARPDKAAVAYPGVDAAWAHARALLPPPPPPAWRVDCVWNARPAEARSGALAAWPERGPAAQALTARLPLALDACQVPGHDDSLARSRFAVELKRRGALAALARAHGLTEARLDGAWRGLPWRDRQRLVRMLRTHDAQDRWFKEELVYNLGRALGVDDADARAWLADYLDGQATLEEHGG